MPTKSSKKSKMAPNSQAVRYLIAHIDDAGRGFILALDDSRQNSNYIPLLKADKSSQWNLSSAKGMVKFSEIIKCAYLHAVVEVFNPPTYAPGCVVPKTLAELCHTENLKKLPTLCHYRARLVLEKTARSSIGYITEVENRSDDSEVLSYLVADPMTCSYVSVPAGDVKDGKRGDPVQLFSAQVGKGAILYRTKGRGKIKLILPARFPLPGGKRQQKFNVYCEIRKCDQWSGCNLDFEKVIQDISNQSASESPNESSAQDSPRWQISASAISAPAPAYPYPEYGHSGYGYGCMPVSPEFATPRSEEDASEDVTIVEPKKEIKEEPLDDYAPVAHQVPETSRAEVRSTVVPHTTEAPICPPPASAEEPKLPEEVKPTVSHKRKPEEHSEAPPEKRPAPESPPREEKHDPTTMIQSELLGFLPRLQRIHAQGKYKQAIQGIVNVLLDLE